MKGRLDEAIEISEKLISKMQNNCPISATIDNLRLYYNIVKLIGDQDETQWVYSELNGYKKLEYTPNYRKIKSRKCKNRFIWVSNNCHMLLAYGTDGNPVQYKLRKIDQKINDQRYKINDQRYNTYEYIDTDGFYSIISTINEKIYEKTLSILMRLKFEKVEVNIFEEMRKTVNKELSEKCPKAFEKLTEAYEDLIKSESSLDLQQVALACREY